MVRRHTPLISNWPLRTGIGLLLAALSPLAAAWWYDLQTPGYGLGLAMLLFGWLPSVFLTDKYRHKYPQRYFTYLFASHAKAAIVMTFGYGAIRLVAGGEAAPVSLLSASLVVFTIADLLVSVPRTVAPTPAARADEGTGTTGQGDDVVAPVELVSIDSAAVRTAVETTVEEELRAFLLEHLPAEQSGIADVRVFEDRPDDAGDTVGAEALGLLIGTRSLNNVKRLNLYLKYCSKQLAMGGYLAVRYTPLSVVKRRIDEQYTGIRRRIALVNHFVWYRAIPKLPYLDLLYFSPMFSWIDRYILGRSKLRTRVLSMAEVWGRLAYYGMEVVAESEGDERFVLARRVSGPVYNRKPSYYAVVALQKVGLDGEVIHLHKVRSMYPFSEFLQKRIFESHGLSSIGKFQDDPRLTEYGPLVRAHWIDELPGLYDWLRGDVKLVGMRATSPHFLSLYPRELYDLYVQIKPGLVPPIFDESTDGFEDIVRIEMEYLKRYLEAPIRTDISYFWYTFRDIVFRNVRSK